MSNLQTFDNLFANLAQSAYERRPGTFTDFSFEEGTVVDIKYSDNHHYGEDIVFGGQNLPNNGVLYVHKDTTVKKFNDINGSGQVY